MKHSKHCKHQLEEASPHLSAKTHADTFFIPRDLDIWPFNPKINGFLGRMMKHFYIKFGDPSCIGFWDVMQKNR